MPDGAVLPDEIRTQRLVLTPLRVDDAAAMVEVLGDPSLYEYTGGAAPDLAELTERYGHQVAGPADVGERWFNWIVRLPVDNRPIGFVQATVTGETAEVAWLIALQWQGQGHATEASRAMTEWLSNFAGVEEIAAHIHLSHAASQRVASALGLAPTPVWEDGEQRWSNRPTSVR